MPSVLGILMSVTITSYSALSIFFLAASPELTVSVRWPSRRKAISSNSQMERSSSQIRMLPTTHLAGRNRSRICSCRRAQSAGFRFAAWALAQAWRFLQRRTGTAQFQGENAALALFRAHQDLAAMRLHDLVHDGQAEPGATLEPRLEGLEHFRHLLGVQAPAVIGKADNPSRVRGAQGHGERAAVRHSAHRVLAQIPENLLHLVAVRPGQRLLNAKPPHDVDVLGAGFFTVLEQGEGVLEQRHHIRALKLILLVAKVGEEIGDDAVQAVG